MMKDAIFTRRTITANSNNENQSETLNPDLSETLGDPFRPPFAQINDPVGNPKRKSEWQTTPSKNAGFKTPEKQNTVSRNRFGWVGNSGTGTDNFEEQNVPSQLPPLNRYGTITPKPYKTLKPSSIHSESSSTHSTPIKSVLSKPSSSQTLNGSNRVGFKGLGFNKENSRSVCTIVDSVQVPHFELREDPSFWMDHNVQVVIRIRPLNNTEKNSFGYNRCLKQESCRNISYIGHQPETKFVFDYVACETINQEMLFRVAGLPMVENCMAGYNSCMFAYGQTGSGKTHTMLGEISEVNVKPSQQRGMTPRIFEFLFARIRAEEESRRDEKLKYICKCSFLEIYNEQITDLLDPSSTNLLLREDTEKGVYVENLTEFEVESVRDILTLIIQGSSNRRVASTNMNRESSRSHSVFTCVIQSSWEKDSVESFRFSRLNLVDLAGSERQKTSGAEGDRLKEAASINKSLSTLGHVIMVLSDLSNGKQRHVPYRDSRLTFLLQDSLGGNSKTMIIANVSPSMCSANETLSTLKFAQRARLIQNNAIVNEDMSGDVQALQHQIRILKEEVSQLKRQKSKIEREEEFDEKDSINNSIRISNKQWKSLEATLAGALRREKKGEMIIKEYEAEIEQLNRLVRQREEDSRCSKMMLKFREDKINRTEALIKKEITSESFLKDENEDKMLEIEILRQKIERNPEVTRFALENIRLLDQLRKYQEFYEEGERDLLMNEISQLRNQLLEVLDGKKPEVEIENQENKKISSGENTSFSYELKKTSEELERCQNDLKKCIEMNEKLTREISDLHLNKCEKEENISVSKQEDQILNLQLELDIFKSIFEEQKSTNFQKLTDLETELNDSKSVIEALELNIKKFTDLESELNISKSVIEALESQNIQLINELESEKSKNTKKDINNNNSIKKEVRRNSLRSLEKDDSPLNMKLRKMRDSVDRVRHLMHGPRESFVEREREMEEVRKQVEIETSEVIVCLQEEIERFEERIGELERENGELMREKEERGINIERFEERVRENERIIESLEREKEERERESERRIKELEREKVERERDWEKIELALYDGNLALEEAFNEVENISGTFSQKSRGEIKINSLIKGVYERNEMIGELNKCLEEAKNVRNDLEWKLKSLREGILVINEANEQERREKEGEIRILEEERREKEKEIRVLEEERENQCDETVLFSIEKDILIDYFISALNESELKIQEPESLLKIREIDFESRTKELESGLRIQEMESELRIQEMDLLSEESVRVFVEREIVLECFIWAKKEWEMENRELKSRFEREVERDESWNKQKEALKTELNEAKAISAQKSFEASNLMTKIEETQETLKDADETVNALIQANETLKREIERYQKAETLILNENSGLIAEVETLKQAETLILNEKSGLLAQIETLKREIERYQQTETLISTEKSGLLTQIETLNSSLKAKETEYELMHDLITDLESYINELQNSVSEKFESLSSDINQVKSEYKICINSSKYNLGQIWQEIIKKDCTISVLNLCQMSILMERITALNAENKFLQNGICENNSLISNLREKAKNELELCSIIKGKLLNDIMENFSKISDMENETNEMKLKFKIFESKIHNLEIQEEIMIERSNYIYNELNILVNDIENKKKCELEIERERIFRVFEELEREMILSKIDNEMIKNENVELRDVIYSLDLSTKTLKEELIHKNVKLEEFFESNTILIDYLQNYFDEFHSKREKTLLLLNENIELVSNKVIKDINEQMNIVSKIEFKFDEMETLFERLNKEKFQREEISKGLLFDLKLLQESSCISRNEKEAQIESLKKELETLKIEMNGKNEEIESILTEIEERNNELEFLKSENSELKSRILELDSEKEEIEEELNEKLRIIEKLEDELIKIQELNYEKWNEIEELKNELGEKDGIIEKSEVELVKIQNSILEKRGKIEELNNEINKLRENLDLVKIISEENEAIAIEARQICDEKTEYAREKEEEVKLLEISIEELESTVYALENKVDLVKEEAEKQRRKREMLEIELQKMKNSVYTKDQILELERNIEMLQKELNEKESEMIQCKGHISQLNMHAEAQAREYKQRFKELESMAHQVKSSTSTGSSDPPTGSSKSKSSNSDPSNGSSNGSSKTTNRGSNSSPYNKTSRGSNSPFKCIGLGIIQQMNSEKEEDFIALKRQIEELEVLASNRQKEIFMLNTRLASAESMTHDVIRDLLGVKMDMSSYASLLDNRQESEIVQELSHEKEEEIKRLKKRLNEFIEERQSWIEEINQRQSEMTKARVLAEQLKQREKLILTENEMLKCENESYKNRVLILEDEMNNKLPSQHSLHLRIHHHAKTKEENSILRQKNEDLSAKLQKTEGLLVNVKNELSRIRVSNRKSDSCYFENQEEENQLRNQLLEESEENRMKLAEKLLNLCTNVLKVAGVTNNGSDINPDLAENALDLVKDHIISLEDEVYDLKLKCKLQSEKELFGRAEMRIFPSQKD